MTNLERLIKDLQTSIGEKNTNGKLRKKRSSTRFTGTNPRAQGTNPRAKGTNIKKIQSEQSNPTGFVLVQNFDEYDWGQLIKQEQVIGSNANGLLDSDYLLEDTDRNYMRCN